MIQFTIEDTTRWLSVLYIADLIPPFVNAASFYESLRAAKTQTKHIVRYFSYTMRNGFIMVCISHDRVYVQPSTASFSARPLLTEEFIHSINGKLNTAWHSKNLPDAGPIG